MYVMSATHNLPGSPQAKIRPTRSGAGASSCTPGPQRKRRRRLTPARPAARMSRATRLRPTDAVRETELGVDPRRAVRAAAPFVDRADLQGEDLVFDGPARPAAAPARC